MTEFYFAIAILQPLRSHGCANSAYSVLVSTKCTTLDKRELLSYAADSCFELSVDPSHMAEVAGSSPETPIL